MKPKKNTNYLERVPKINEKIKWDIDDKGIVTICIDNKGIMKRLTQLLLKKPKKTYIHLDREGSLAWCQINGEQNIGDIARALELDAESEDLQYERLAKYFSILHSYGFVKYK